jgi:hypothetical protein
MNKEKIMVSVGVLVAVASAFFFIFPKKANAALSSSSVTLSNSRLSYKAGVASGSSGSSIVTVTATGFPDNNTNHLFPGDVLCFTDAGQNGCIGNKTYTVDSIVNSTTFNLTAPLSNNLDTSGYAVASQSATWTVAFTTGSVIPVDGSILITIPEADNVNAKGNDGIPDSAGSVGTSGFDLNKLTAGSISITGCSPAYWGTPVITVGSGTGDHTIAIPRDGAHTCAGGTAIVVTIAGNGIVNPAPITSGHAQGTADIYGVTVATRDGGNNVIESSIPRAFLVEAVLISATVDESLSFIVSGLSSGSSYCGNTASVSATATSIPWGHLTSANTFYYADQQLIINTNSSGGYSVTIEENDQMGKNGNVCTDTTPSAGNYTFGSGTCIRDTVCASSNCSESVASDWTNATSYPGLGYSLASQSGTDAPFFYNEKNRTWSAKQLADKTEGAETPQAIMSNSGPVSGSSVYVCYRITIPGNQPSGYYYNIAKYTATATF